MFNAMIGVVICGTLFHYTLTALPLPSTFAHALQVKWIDDNHLIAMFPSQRSATAALEKHTIPKEVWLHFVSYDA